VFETNDFPATLFVVGVSGRCAPLADGEPLSIDAADLGRIASAVVGSGAHEAAVLSTEERTECYVVAASEHAALAAVSRGLADALGADRLTVSPGCIVERGERAAHRLLRAACGLDAPPGTEDALAPVQRAHVTAQTAGTVGALLRRVFEGAVTAATRARAAGADAASVEGRIAHELARIDDWRVRREAFATVVA
jgi:glutamyl-tRNA reductase